MTFANYDYNKAIDDRNYNYQVERDKVADSQWEREYALSKKNSTASKSSSSRSSSKTPRQAIEETTGNSKEEIATPTYEEIMSNIGYLQGTGFIDKPIVDKLTGKKYATIEELLSSYGYALLND